jgi:hypothetical protein
MFSQQVDIAELPCMFNSHGNEGVFVFSGKDLPRTVDTQASP